MRDKEVPCSGKVQPPNSYILYCRLRLRLKSMQQVVDAQSERLALYQAEKEMASLSHQDHSTGQGE